MKKQTKKASMIEAWSNILVGLGINTTLNYLLLPLFGMHPTVADSLGLAMIFTLVSVVRTYMLRRSFETMRVMGLLP